MREEGILHTQERIGKGGKPFKLYKVRTMNGVKDMRPDAVRARFTGSQTDAHRTTPLGSLLRLMGIDELPQIWNILRGDISFVGPRAERPEFDAQLAQQIPFYLERYLVRPGLSGWAQINYPYGASIEDSRNKLEYDLYYMKHQSLALDLEIILKTISTTLRFAGR
jgi:lipopolysaccharide/colanic/teichoic acid biosynthesis glycosyltransferase